MARGTALQSVSSPHNDTGNCSRRKGGCSASRREAAPTEDRSPAPLPCGVIHRALIICIGEIETYLKVQKHPQRYAGESCYDGFPEYYREIFY